MIVLWSYILGNHNLAGFDNKYKSPNYGYPTKARVDFTVPESEDIISTTNVPETGFGCKVL